MRMIHHLLQGSINHKVLKKGNPNPSQDHHTDLCQLFVLRSLTFTYVKVEDSLTLTVSIRATFSPCSNRRSKALWLCGGAVRIFISLPDRLHTRHKSSLLFFTFHFTWRSVCFISGVWSWNIFCIVYECINDWRRRSHFIFCFAVFVVVVVGFKLSITTYELMVDFVIIITEL